MQEFKSISFIIIDRDGSAHRIAVDALEGEYPTFTMKGDQKLLLSRWKMMSERIERQLRTDTREARRFS